MPLEQCLSLLILYNNFQTGSILQNEEIHLRSIMCLVHTSVREYCCNQQLIIHPLCNVYDLNGIDINKSKQSYCVILETILVYFPIQWLLCTIYYQTSVQLYCGALVLWFKKHSLITTVARGLGIRSCLRILDICLQGWSSLVFSSLLPSLSPHSPHSMKLSLSESTFPPNYLTNQLTYHCNIITEDNWYLLLET